MNKVALAKLLKRHGIRETKIQEVVLDTNVKTLIKIPKKVYDKMRDHVATYGYGAIALSRSKKYYNIAPERVSISHAGIGKVAHNKGKKKEE